MESGLLDTMNQLSISEYNPRMKYCDKFQFANLPFERGKIPFSKGFFYLYGLFANYKITLKLHILEPPFMVSTHFHFNGFFPNMLYFFRVFFCRLCLLTPTFIIEPKFFSPYSKGFFICKNISRLLPNTKSGI